MRYYVVSDVHGFYSKMCDALRAAGYYDDQKPHKLIICGDCFDRGDEAVEMQSFLMEHLNDPDVILIKGNHEDLFEDFILRDHGRFRGHHISNGTVDTALQLTGYNIGKAQVKRGDFVEACFETPYYKDIIPATRNYYETKSFIFVHGYVPCKVQAEDDPFRGTRYVYSPIEDWRNASDGEWENARWINGMDAARTVKTGKTVVCGHWHSSYGHAVIEGKCSEFGDDADFSPYYGNGVIAIDACTAYSGKVNVLVVEDDELRSQEDKYVDGSIAVDDFCEIEVADV